MERAGYEWFRRRLERARNRAYTDIRRDVPVYFSAIEGNLRKALRPIAPAKTGSYAAATAGLLVDYGARLGRKLACIRSIADQDKIHGARIAGKRLRYILEPLAAELSGAKRTVESLKTFQDRFGLLCDDFARARALRRTAETWCGSRRARRSNAHPARARKRRTVSNRYCPDWPRWPGGSSARPQGVTRLSSGVISATPAGHF